MASLKLVIGNKKHSSWSLRPWLAMTVFEFDFEEVLIPFGDPIGNAEWVAQVAAYSPAGKVPALVDGDVRVWDSLAIMEYLADIAPERPIWPRERAARALARSISAEMHSGFQALRGACPMNLGKRFAPRDRRPAVQRDVDRITAIWRDARAAHGRDGPFLFGEFSAADAMYAPVATRFHSYSIGLDADARAYVDAIYALPAFQAWRAAGIAETAVVPEDEVDEPVLEIFRS